MINNHILSIIQLSRTRMSHIARPVNPERLQHAFQYHLMHLRKSDIDENIVLGLEELAYSTDIDSYVPILHGFVDLDDAEVISKQGLSYLSR